MSSAMNSKCAKCCARLKISMISNGGKRGAPNCTQARSISTWWPAGSSNPADGKQKSQTVEPKAVMPHASLPVMDMVAEYMIYANSAVAQQIYKSFPTEAALRRHPLPRTERLDDLVATAALQGVVLDPVQMLRWRLW